MPRSRSWLVKASAWAGGTMTSIGRSRWRGIVQKSTWWLCWYSRAMASNWCRSLAITSNTWYLANQLRDQWFVTWTRRDQFCLNETINICILQNRQRCWWNVPLHPRPQPFFDSYVSLWLSHGQFPIDQPLSLRTFILAKWFDMSSTLYQLDIHKTRQCEPVTWG